jgi:hypothetical protein
MRQRRDSVLSRQEGQGQVPSYSQANRNVPRRVAGCARILGIETIELEGLQHWWKLGGRRKRREVVGVECK